MPDVLRSRSGWQQWQQDTARLLGNSPTYVSLSTDSAVKQRGRVVDSVISFGWIFAAGSKNSALTGLVRQRIALERVVKHFFLILLKFVELFSQFRRCYKNRRTSYEYG